MRDNLSLNKIVSAYSAKQTHYDSTIFYEYGRFWNKYKLRLLREVCFV